VSATGDGDRIERAGRIVAQSDAAAIVERVVRRLSASVESSRLLAPLRRALLDFRSLPARERTICTGIALVAALAGHLLLAAQLPESARPATALSSLALLGAFLAATRASTE
jgi:hypothetical protein